MRQTSERVKITLLVIYIDLMRNNKDPRVIQLRPRFENQLQQIQISQLMPEMLGYYYYNLQFEPINSVQYGDAVILLSCDKNIDWIKRAQYANARDHIKQLAQQQSHRSYQVCQSFRVKKSAFQLQNLLSPSRIQVPEQSLRRKNMQTSMESLQNVSLKMLNTRTSSDPFLITNQGQKTQTSTHHQQRTMTNISMKTIVSQKRKPFYSTEELDYLENMDECNLLLEQYIVNLKSNLSKDKIEQDQILDFYEKIICSNPKSRIIENSIGSNTMIRSKLEEILKLQPKLKPRQHFKLESKLDQFNLPLCSMNIPSMNNESGLNRTQLYSFYSLYKVLHLITAYQQKNKRSREKYSLSQGLNYQTFRNGIEQIQDQSDKIAEGIFNIIDKKCSGFLNWQQFLYLMSSVQAKTKDERLDLFIKIADSDGSGSLSFQEVVTLSRQTLTKFIKVPDESFMDSLSEYFAKMIFDSCQCGQNEELPFHNLKQIIKQEHPNSDLICMFCGVDLIY